MRKLRGVILSAIFLVVASFGAGAQIVATHGDTYDIDSLRRDFDSRPSFGLYKDNYFIFN